MEKILHQRINENEIRIRKLDEEKQLNWRSFAEDKTQEECDIALSTMQRKIDHHKFVVENRID